MAIFYIILYIILALFIGSFLNVVALRVPLKQSIVKPGSRCPNCQHSLGWLDLVPVLSYIVSRGRCRYCQARVSPLYLLGEMTTLFLFLLVPIKIGLTWEMLVAYPLMMLLVVVLISDLQYKIIPDRIIYPGIILFFLLRVFIHPLPLWDHVIGALVGGGLLLLIAIVSRGGMGGGDIKLFFLLGIVLGWQLTLLTLFIAVLLGTIIGGLLMIRGRVRRGEPMAFGPYIVLAAVVTYFWGQEILEIYLSLFKGF